MAPFFFSFHALTLPSPRAEVLPGPGQAAGSLASAYRGLINTIGLAFSYCNISQGYSGVMPVFIPTVHERAPPTVIAV